jgi:HEAT repeat protein
MNNPKYEPVQPLSKRELILQIESGDPQAVSKALYSAAKYEEDWKWVQSKCLEALKSPEVSVRWAAATCLGDLAFMRRPLDTGSVIPALELATQDPQIADPAGFSLSMVRQFLQKQ